MRRQKEKMTFIIWFRDLTHFSFCPAFYIVKEVKGRNEDSERK